MKFYVYQVKLQLIEKLLGTVPKDPDVYARYIATKAPSPDLAEDEVAAEQAREDVEKSGWTGFHMDSQGVYLYNYQILGYLKEAGNVLKDQLKAKNLRSKIDNYVFVEPRRIYLGQTPAGHIERPLRAMTMQGPRVTVTRSDYMPEGTEIVFKIRVLDNKDVNGDILQEILAFGEFRGLGQFRNGGYGRFRVIEWLDLGIEQYGRAV